MSDYEKKNNSKTWILVTIIAILVVALVALIILQFTGGDRGASAQVTPTPAAEATPAPTPEPTPTPEHTPAATPAATPEDSAAAGSFVSSGFTLRIPEDMSKSESEGMTTYMRFDLSTGSVELVMIYDNVPSGGVKLHVNELTDEQIEALTAAMVSEVEGLTESHQMIDVDGRSVLQVDMAGNEDGTDMIFRCFIFDVDGSITLLLTGNSGTSFSADMQGVLDSLAFTE